MNDYNVTINSRNFFDQTIKNYIKTYNNLRKNTIDYRDVYTASCLLGYI